ncbi:MAG: shikimate dehydrogenase [Proteobacteria bacterium]|nr:shikimate dehydrogenase [Pseudomonadota bacterium]MBU1612542.1 shikimate dehydrogenase [Pseudomonadota bacterium]
MKQYGIIGHPLGHTMSPTLHNWGFKQHGINAIYEAWPTSPEDLPAFMEQYRREQVQGLSITIPHKQAIIPMLDRLTNRARAVGAVNTLFWENETLIGDNTDVAGVVNPIKSRNIAPESALILGAGGAARAAVAGCQELGVLAIGITNRTKSKAETIALDFGIEVVDWDLRHDLSPELLINSTPLGMSGDLELLSPWNATHLTEEMTIFDLVYNPLETVFLENGLQAGATTIQGIEMFLSQGLEQFRLWTGIALDSEGARNLLLEKLT